MRVMARSHLQDSLDREVYQIVQDIYAQNPGSRISVASVYDTIKRSNSRLSRRPKNQLEGSIDRVLSVLEEEAASDSGAEIEARQQEIEPESTNAMNNDIVKKMKKAAKEQKRAAAQARSDAEQAEASVPNGATPDGEKSKKKRKEQDLAERPAKRSRRDDSSYAAPTHVSLADLGGMEKIIEELEENVWLPMRRPEHYMERGLKIPRGILLHGPPGCGKTMLCQAIAAELKLPFVEVSAPSIVSGMSGESEKAIREHFEKARSLAPCIMFIDEIDTITPKRENAQREMERRMVGQLLTCMDDLALEKNDGKPVIVLAATNRPDSLDPALRRAGRFDIEVNIGVPNEAVREQILRTHTRQTAVASDVDFSKLAKMTPGFVGADLESLVLKAGNVSNVNYIRALKAQAQALQNDTNSMDVDGDDSSRQESSKVSPAVAALRALDKVLLDKDKFTSIPNDPIKMSDFEAALQHIQPSAKREGFATIPETTWSNIGALEHVRHALVEAVVKPIQSPDRYARFGIEMPTGVLLWGPPGCGKTLLAKAVANESKANFISVKGPELLNKYVGESERAVRRVFFRARSSVPCVIFFDELDALVPKRDDALSDASARVVNTLLTELDGIGSNKAGIYIIAATNRPDIIDPAMLRPGRLGKHLYVGLPGPAERTEILRTQMKRMPTPAGADLASFAAGEVCANFTGADLANLASEAAQKALQREDAEVVEWADLEEAVKEMKPSVSKQELAKFEMLRLKV